jgi:hypothetical protein
VRNAVVRRRLVGTKAPARARPGAGQCASNDVHVVFLSPAGVPASATAFSAASKCGGNARPRASARRRIPAQARALKKYRCGTSPVSKTSDNEHTLSSLRDGTPVAVHSHKLSVQNAVGEPIPEVAQEPEEGTKVPSSV